MAHFLRGYRQVDLGGGQPAFVASPEKALLDLIHLHPGAASLAYLRELCLQNLDRLNLDELQRLAESRKSQTGTRGAIHHRTRTRRSAGV